MDHGATPGSPPRMRGILQGPVGQLLQLGITPAHAGNTLSLLSCLVYVEDHPRACGEYRNCLITSSSDLGSPPRMRGIRGAVPGGRRPSGITPAHAGNTKASLLSVSQNWDHPRACGEYVSTRALKCSLMGSPPRMRGILFFLL